MTQNSINRRTRTTRVKDKPVLVPLGDIADVKLGKMLDRSKHKSGRNLPYLRNINVRWGHIDTADVSKMFFKNEDEEERYSVRKGDVLVCEGGEPGRAAVWTQEESNLKFQKALHRVRFRNPYEPKLLVYFLEWAAGCGALERRFTGSTIKHFTKQAFVQLPVPNPPLPEQRRIVARIEELFSRLDAGVAALHHAKAQLRRYRQSVLAAAVTGQLTQAWREQHPDTEPANDLLKRTLEQREKNWAGRGKYKVPTAPENSELPALPEGWIWTTMEQLGLVIGGLTKNSKRNSLQTKLPYLRVANIYADELRLDEIKKIGVAESELGKLLLRKNDLLVVEGNGSKNQIGRLAIWDGSIEPCVHQNHLIKVRLTEPKLGKFVMAWMLSPSGRPHIERVASSTSGLYTLSVGKVSELPVPLPPIAEQSQIVAEVESRTTAIEQLEAELDRQITRSSCLRQSTLHAAFREQLKRSGS